MEAGWKSYQTISISLTTDSLAFSEERRAKTREVDMNRTATTVVALPIPLISDLVDCD